MPVNSSNLSAFELLHRENLFIRLKNQGKNLDEIALLLDVEKELVGKWNEIIERDKQGWYEIGIKNNDTFVGKLLKKGLIKSQIVRKRDGLMPKIIPIYSKLGEIITVIAGLEEGLFSGTFNRILSENGIDNLLIKTQESISILVEYVESIDVKIGDTINENSIRIYSSKNEDYKVHFEEVNYYLSFALNLYRDVTKQNLINYSSDDRSFANYYHTLPYALKQLKIQNYHSITNIHLENLNIDAQWIFLFGENGFGKTSILQAIALGLLANSKETENINIEKTTKIGIEFINDYANQRNNLNDNTKYPVENIVCYGSSRLNMGRDDTKEDEMQKSGLTYSLFHTDGRLLNIEKYFKQWFLDKDERFEKVIEAFKIIIPYLHDIQVVKNEQREFEVHYFEKELTENGESGASYQKVSFNHLAAGLKSVLAMVGDMFIRLYRTQPSVINPSELVGIAIIDELELHLHPKWQIKLPHLLSTVFPKVQFIVSTHSAIPLLGATPNAVFIKVTRDKENGIQAQKMDIDLKNLTPNQLFYFLFDMESITSVNNTNLAEVRTEDTKAEFLQNDEVKRRLKAFETKKADTDFPDDLFEPENSTEK